LVYKVNSSSLGFTEAPKALAASPPDKIAPEFPDVLFVVVEAVLVTYSSLSSSL
jgi:hypothetical protein